MLNRRFLAYLGSAALADTGFWIYTVVQGWLVLTMTNSPVWLGLVAASGQLPFLLFTMLGGSLADRFERRTLIAVGNGSLAAIAALQAALVASGHISILLLSILAFAIGTIIALEHPVDRAWLYDLVRGEQLGRAIALSSLEWSVARTLGPAIGGVAIATIGIAAGYGAFALSLLPMSVLAIVLSRKGSGGSPAATDAGPQSNSNFTRIIVPFSILIAAFTIGINPYITLLPDIARNVLHLDARGYGILSACGGAGAIAAAVALTSIGELRSKGRIIPALMLAAALLLVAFTFARTTLAAGALLFGLGAIDTLMYALANTYVQQCAGHDERGRANGMFSLAFLGGIPIGNAAIGTLAGAVGSEEALALAALLAVAATFGFWVLAPLAREAA